MRMRAWYDIFQFGGGPEDEAGHPRVAEAARRTDCSEETRACREDRARRLLAGRRDRAADRAAPSRAPGRGHGAVDLPAACSDAGEGSAAQRTSDLPIFMAHGSYDDIIPLDRARSSRGTCWRSSATRSSGTTYPMPHSVCPEEIGTSPSSCSGFSDHLLEAGDLVVVAALGDALRHVDVLLAADRRLEVLAAGEDAGAQRDRGLAGARRARGSSTPCSSSRAAQREARQRRRARQRLDADARLVLATAGSRAAPCRPPSWRRRRAASRAARRP